ncbi:hypothetical protein [Actinoplanes sp. ATCC 53533]|uniref:hypothetical protein n=1 Tax=Actinoplanes sp. ATCC 53533 TaxID=1288362 RepID=UPI000F77FF60|nr:hypothetical protein [Actinoplanes sp. ATCC 53533]
MRTIANVVGGSLHDGGPDTLVTGPVCDGSRLIEPEGLFVASSGHDAIRRAVAGGVGAVFADRPVGVSAVDDDVRAENVVTDGIGRPSLPLRTQAGSAPATAALRSAAARQARGRRLFAVPGQLNEPGRGRSQHHTESQHRIEVGCLAAFASVRYLIGNANAGRLVSAAYGGVEAEHVPKAAAALHLIRRRWAPDDVVPLKGSHDVGLQAVARQLVEGGAPERASATRSEVACRSTAPSTCEGSA